MNKLLVWTVGLACAPTWAAAVACGSSSAGDNGDAGGIDATTRTSGGDATAEVGQNVDATQNTVVDVGDGGAGEGAIDSGGGGASDSGRDSGLDSSDAAGVFGCDGGAPWPPDATLAPVHICSFADGSADFPLFDKSCCSSADCTIGVYEFSCCGDTLALGMNKSQVLAFQAAVAGWTCAACGCMGRGMHTEDGEGGVADAGVKCDRGWCMTYAR